MPHQTQTYLRITKIHVYCGSVFLTVLCVGSLSWVVIVGRFNVGNIKPTWVVLRRIAMYRYKFNVRMTEWAGSDAFAERSSR
jgi:hypothetical protein